MITIREYQTDQEFEDLYTYILLLNEKMTKQRFLELLPQMRAQGYRCIGAYEGKDCMGICGFWVGTRFWCGRHIDIDNFVLTEDARSKGVGAAMLRWIEEEGRRQNCDMAMLDTYADNYRSHKFYYREGYYILGYHFVKELSDAD